MTEYPSAEEVFGPGRVVRIDRYDALRDDRSEARYADNTGEPDTLMDALEAFFRELDAARERHTDAGMIARLDFTIGATLDLRAALAVVRGPSQDRETPAATGDDDCPVCNGSIDFPAVRDPAPPPASGFRADLDVLLAAFADVPEAVRVLKIGEEFGEASQAYIGVAGLNPRKGVTHTNDELADELADVALTALVALGAFAVDPIQRLTNRVRFVAERHIASRPAPPQETTPE